MLFVGGITNTAIGEASADILAGLRVSLLVDLDAQCRQPAQRITAHRYDVLADARGKAHHVDAAQHLQVGAHVLAQPMDEHRIGQFR